MSFDRGGIAPLLSIGLAYGFTTWLRTEARTVANF